MPPLRRPSRWLRTAAVAGLLLAPSLAAREGLAAPTRALGGVAVASPMLRDLDAQLAEARLASDAAEAALDAAKRVSTPGHLLDPLPPSLMAGVGEFQAEYAEMERKAAGYRATLGDQHPTLKGAEEVLAELRGQILDGARRAAAVAQQEATRARATVESLARQARAAEATGSVAASVPAPVEAARPDAAPRDAGLDGSDPTGQMPAEAPPPTSREPQAAPGWTASASQEIARALPLALRHPWAAGAVGLLGGGVALLALAALSRPRRRRPTAAASVRIEPGAPIKTVSTTTEVAVRPDPLRRPAPLAVLAVLPLRTDDDPAKVRAWLDRDADDGLARAAASAVATLASAAGERIVVAVMPAGGASVAQARAAALALASAAARAGRRALLVDGSADGRLGRALAPGAPVAATAEVGGRLRTVLRATVAGRVMAVLDGDADEPAAGSAVPRLETLDGFDAVVVAGALGSGEVVPAGLALLVAPRGFDPAELADAARIAGGAPDRPCGVLLIEPADVAVTDAPRLPDPFPSRRRAGPEAAAARLGLRRTFDPARRTGTRAG